MFGFHGLFSNLSTGNLGSRHFLAGSTPAPRYGRQILQNMGCHSGSIA